MGRKTEFPDVFTIRLREGGIAALKAVLLDGESVSDAAREAVQMLVAERRLWEASRPKPLTPVVSIDSGGCAPPVYTNPGEAE